MANRSHFKNQKKMKENKEYKFITAFVESYRNAHSSKAVQPVGNNQSKYADCEIVLNNEIVKIEAKLLNDTNSNSTDFYNLIGEIIGTLKKPSLLKEQGESFNEVVGFLVPFESKTVFYSLWQKNIKPNGVKYCSAFNVKYLLVYNQITSKIDVLTFDTNNDEWK